MTIPAIPSHTHSLTLRRRIRASPERVFRAWTVPAEMQRWWLANEDMGTPEIKADVRVGGRLWFNMPNHKNGRDYIGGGVYAVVDPPKRLEFTWIWEPQPDRVGDHEANVETYVSIQLSPADDGRATDLVLTHSRFPTEAMRDSHNGGWSHILTLLGEFILE